MTQPDAAAGLGARLSEAELCPDDLLAEQEAAFARDIERLHTRSAEFVEVSCPACSGLESNPAFEKYGFAFRSCNRCRTIYMSPRPSPQVMGDYYANSENYAYWAKHIFPASEAARREKIHKPWLERVAGYCDRHGVERGTLLEIGPGFGTFAEVATVSGAFRRVVAVEPTPEMAAACRARGVEVIEARVEDADLSQIGRVDVVVSFEVIEHLFRPADLPEQAARLLKPGGLLVLSCPNGLGFDIAMLGPRSQAVDAEHVNLFNPESMATLLDAAGFEVAESGTPGRLDAEIVREVALREGPECLPDPFLRRVLLEDWEKLGWPFQQFLAANGLSSHMWVAARLR
jgi:SAM-dependent methyltransferase